MHGQGNGGGQWGNGQPPGGQPPQPGNPQPGHPQQGYAQPGHPQQGYPQPGHAPPGYPQPGPPQQPYAGPPAQLTSGLYVTAEYIFLQWMLMMTSPVITVYGRPIPFKWNRPQVVPLPPGNHPINIHFPWVFQKGNSTDAVVPVHPGHATELKYSTSFFVFTSGTIAPRGFRPWGT